MKFFFGFLFSFLAGSPAIAGGQLDEAIRYYKEGDYVQALSVARKITRSSDPAGVLYFEGVLYSKLQEFSFAENAFAKAEKLGSKSSSIHYERGQALFALQRFSEADNEFTISSKSGYKSGASLYYLGYINQLAGNYEKAKFLYGLTGKLSADEDGVKLSAQYQIAEIAFLENGKIKDPDQKYDDLVYHVLPMYESIASAEAEPSAGNDVGLPYASAAESVAGAAEQRLREVHVRIDEAAPHMRNGMPLPIRPYTLHLSQALEYNSNVITQADNTLINVSRKDSAASTTSIFGLYQWNFKDTWSFLPEIYAAATLYSRHNTAVVYQNDNIDLAPAFRTRFEHWIYSKPATALLDLEYDYLKRDYLERHQFPYYSRYLNIKLGERARLLDAGATTVKFGVKFYENVDPSINDYTPMVSLDQIVRIFGGYDLDNFASFDYLHARQKINDERNYTLRESVTFPKVFARVDFIPSFTFAMKDTMNQRYFRGMEKLFNPALLLSRAFGKKWSGDFSYNYVRYLSNSKDQYQYIQHDAKVSATYRF